MVPVWALLAEWKWAALVLALVGAYGWGRHDGGALALSDALRDAQVAAVAVDAAQRGAALEISKLEIKNITVQRRIERETREVPVYRDCKHSADGLRLLDAALGSRALPADSGELPGNTRAAAGR